MKVFISHKSEDIINAEKYAASLSKLGFEFYLDKYDPVITGSPDRAHHIQMEIEMCTDLLVIITPKTQESWWVPFEIGLSTANDIRIASIKQGDVNLPSFIRKWPIIDSTEKYTEYLNALKVSNRQLIKSRNFSESFESSGIKGQRISESFHKTLMEKFRLL